ncbi:hypothetical protein EGW03_06305 [bacterium]|nr:hypothetical protein [bacterium]
MLDWFTTIPGILVICGVILLVIAIILFIAGNKKAKKEEMVQTNPVTESANTMNTEVNTTADTNIGEVNVQEVSPVMEQASTIPTESVSLENNELPKMKVESNNDVSPIQIEEPVQIPSEEIHIEEPVKISDTEIHNEEASIPKPVSIPSIDNSVNSMDTVSDETSFNIPIPTEKPSFDNTSTSIYGGASPISNISMNEEKPVTIYGGNDPLEATQSIPKVEEHHEPYGGVYPEAKIVDMNASTVTPTPVEEVVSAMPVTDTNLENNQVEDTTAPSVVTIPEEKPVVEEL